MTELRKVFAATEDAKAAALKLSAFSYLSKGGACPVCKGMGRSKVDMDFLGSIWMPCEECGGHRYREELRCIRWQGKSLGDILAMTVTEASSLPVPSRKWTEGMALLLRVGLGHLRLGQGADTLSGGEGQRMALASQLLGKKKSGPCLYLFDEPTIGLHRRDVEALCRLFDSLVDEGHDLIVVEHDLDVAQHGDWILDLGPGGGPDGGKVMIMGRPVELAACEKSRTGRALAGLFASKPSQSVPC